MRIQGLEQAGIQKAPFTESYLTPLPSSQVRAAFYIFINVQNLVAISAIWARCADVFNAEAASRLFGFVSAGQPAMLSLFLSLSLSLSLSSCLSPSPCTPPSHPSIPCLCRRHCGPAGRLPPHRYRRQPGKARGRPPLRPHHGLCGPHVRSGLPGGQGAQAGR